MRLWGCPTRRGKDVAVPPIKSEARGRAASPAFQRMARAEGPTSLLFSLGILHHPADNKEASAEGGHTVTYHEGWPSGCSGLAGDIFIVGSAEGHRISELSRVGWAVVLVASSSLRPLVTVAGPVWSPLDQTAATAEKVAISVAHQHAVGRCRLWSDCAHALRLFPLPLLQKVRRKRPFRRHCFQPPEVPRCRQRGLLQWGRAHRCLDGLSGHELFLGTGNDLVDAAALVGRCRRPLRRGIDKLSSDITTCECVWGTIA